MINLDKNTYLKMAWTYVRYVEDGMAVTFLINPMERQPDIVYLPLNQKGLEKAITYIKEQKWNRKLVYQIVDYVVEPVPLHLVMPEKGTLEDTEAAKEFDSLSMFDPGFDLSEDNVHGLWCTLERRFAEAAEGEVRIKADSFVEGSVFDRVSIPVLMNNKKVTLMFVGE